MSPQSRKERKDLAIGIKYGPELEKEWYIMSIMFDVSGLIPEAQQPALAVAQVCWQHTRSWFIGLISFGSTVKGGMISGASDIDLHLYLEDTAFTPEGTLPLTLALAIHQDLARIDPRPFRYIDLSPEPRTPPAGEMGYYIPPYHIIAGTLPLPEATAEEVRELAREELAELEPTPSFLIAGLLKHGGGRGQLAPMVRLFCQIVWPVLYHVLVLQAEDAVGVWRLTKEQAIERIPANTSLGQPLRMFYTVVRAYYPAESSLAHALTIIQHGSAFLIAAKAWAERQ